MRLPLSSATARFLFVLLSVLGTVRLLAQTHHAPMAATISAPASSDGSLHLMITPRHPETLNMADFAAIPHKTVTARNGHTNTDETYSGVPVTDLLAKYGPPTGKDLHGKPLSDYLVVTGSDGYKAVLSLAETDPSFHPGDVIVADTLNGKPLDAKEGPFKLVVTEDKRPARCVHNLVSIELRTAD